MTRATSVAAMADVALTRILFCTVVEALFGFRVTAGNVRWAERLLARPHGPRQTSRRPDLAGPPHRCHGAVHDARPRPLVA
jgi:hypothetical protein